MTLSKQERKEVLIALLTAQLQQLQSLPSPAVLSKQKDTVMSAEGAAAGPGWFGSVIFLLSDVGAWISEQRKKILLLQSGWEDRARVHKICVW